MYIYKEKRERENNREGEIHENNEKHNEKHMKNKTKSGHFYYFGTEHYAPVCI